MRPPSARQNFTDTSSVEKYQMPETQYEQLSDTVLAWKKKQKLGRFDPNAKSAKEMAEERRSKDEEEIKRRAIEVGMRCRVGRDDTRRGIVRFVGEIVGLGGEREAGCRWVGVELDEPVGRNDGSAKIEVEGGALKSKKVFECKDKFGVFIRPEKVEVGDWLPLDDLEVDEDMEEI
jgi:tubulin-folding cofactor B